jgi:hypothetical protein
VAETVQHFITAMDSLKLNLAAVDQVGGSAWVGESVGAAGCRVTTVSVGWGGESWRQARVPGSRRTPRGDKPTGMGWGPLTMRTEFLYAKYQRERGGG